jgi:hypothetical protein
MKPQSVSDDEHPCWISKGNSMQSNIIIRPLKVLAVVLAMSAGFTGCVQNVQTPTPVPFVSGNWQIDSSDPKAAALSPMSGSLNGTSTNVSGTLHVNSMTSCVKPTDAIQVTGWANQGAVLTLTAPLAGGVLTIQGVLASDGRSMGETWYQVQGGACSMPATQGAAQNYRAVTGTYTGSIQDASGLVSSLTVNLTQSPQSDALGNYSLTGQGTFKAFPCITTPTQLTNTVVTGSNIKMTYIDSITANSVVISGQVQSDGQSMVVTNWTLSGGCSADSGTGKLFQKSSE